MPDLNLGSSCGAKKKNTKPNNARGVDVRAMTGKGWGGQIQAVVRRPGLPKGQPLVVCTKCSWNISG
eukprot:2657257-Pyramimonas_sp.AAC.1